MDKKPTRKRRARRTTSHIRNLNAHALRIHRSANHIYVQLIDPTGARVLAAASSLDPAVRKQLKNGGNIAAAVQVGKMIAEKINKLGVKQVAFDRAGFRYHGRVKALADAARESGINF